MARKDRSLKRPAGKNQKYEKIPKTAKICENVRKYFSMFQQIFA